MAASTDADTFELVLDQLDEPWACNSPRHGDSEVHGGPATHCLERLCQCCDGLRCQPYIDYIADLLAKNERTQCRKCGQVTYTDEVRIIPITQM